MRNRGAFAAALAVAGLVAFGFAAAASSSPSRGGVTVSPRFQVQAKPASGGRAAVSQPARSLPVVRRASGGGNVELPPNRPDTESRTKKAGGEPLDATPLAPRAPRDAVPGPALTFEGISSAAPGALGVPDPNGDVGTNHYVQMVNKLWAVYNKAGTLLGGPFAENSLWQGTGIPTTPCKTSDRGDPVVLYDELADRWLLSFFAFAQPGATPPFYECIAISQTSDPLGSWWVYSFNLSSVPAIGNSFPDYPKFGVFPDSYYMSANLFPATGQDGLMVAFDRVTMLNGTAMDPSFFYLVDTTLNGNLLPADLDGGPPPAGSPGYFLVPDPSNFALLLYRWTVDWTPPASAGYEVKSIPVAQYDWLVCSPNSPVNSQCIHQPGTPNKLDPLDNDQLMFRLTYRNFGTHESLLASQTIDVANDGSQLAGVAGIRWYEIRSPRTTPLLHQQGNHFESSTHRWSPAIASDVYGNIALGYNVSNSTSVFPGIRYAARRPGDPLGTLPLTETTLIAGAGSKTGFTPLPDGRARWGDYNSMAVDPVDDCTFWFTGEYLSHTDLDDWNTRIGVFRISPCPGAVTPQPPQPPPADTTPPINPVVTSPTHRVGVASRNRQPQIRWSGASDSQSGVDGFSFHLDTSDISTPDRTKDGEENLPGVNYVPLPNGRYFFHIITRDNAGNWTNPRHFGPIVIAVPRGTTGVRCRVPNVRGKTVAQARRQLSRANCRLGRTRRVFSNRVRSGRIVKQSRRPGARLAKGTRVNVDVSRGRRR